MENPTIWLKYRSNFPRKLLAVTLYLQTEIIRIMATRGGHDQLRLNFEPYLMLINDGCDGLSELAARLKITKQAAAQTIAELVRLGYVERAQSVEDGRAKTLSVTDAGQQMMADGLRAYIMVEKRFLQFASTRQLDAALAALVALNRSLSLCYYNADRQSNNRGEFGLLLSRVSDYVSYRLMELTRAQGHEKLKLSFAHILTLLRPNGTKIQDIVRVRGLSKQAVGAIANELEELGYIYRKPDPESPRQQRLHLSEKGFDLIQDSATSVDLLEEELAGEIGKTRLNALKRCMEAIYDGLELAKVEFGELFDLALEQRAAELQAELGPERARTLGRILTS